MDKSGKTLTSWRSNKRLDLKKLVLLLIGKKPKAKQRY